MGGPVFELCGETKGLWLCLFLCFFVCSLPRPGASVYFQSNPSCGLNSSGFIDHGSDATAALSSLGVCNWGYNSILPIPGGLTGSVDQCLQCFFVPAFSPSCPDNYSLIYNGQWDLFPSTSCQLSGCLDVDCPEGTIEIGQSAMCPGSKNRAKTCCPKVPQMLCCTSLQCISKDSPSGDCVALNSNQDLLPGQTIMVPKYAVPVGLDCPGPMYRFSHAATCQEDHKFAMPHYYDECEPPPASSTDSNGCPILSGYTFRPWVTLSELKLELYVCPMM